MIKTIFTIILFLIPVSINAFVDTGIQIGSKGSNVTELQEILVYEGFLKIPQGVSYGYFGSLTEDALKKYQCSKGIVCNGTFMTTGYGAVGPKTKDSLNVSNYLSLGSTNKKNGEVLGSSVINASSCSRDDIVSAIASAVDGSTIQVPPGDCTWNSAIGISKKITVSGSGIGNTIIRINKGGFSLTEESRITGFTFLSSGKSTGDYHVKAYVDTWFEVDHNRFESLNGTKQLGVRASSPNGGKDPKGLIHNNEFYNTRTLVQGDLASGTSGFGRDIWALSDRVPGTANTVFIEDNEFILTVFGNVMDNGYGGHYVFRHNTVTDGSVEAHGITSSSERGSKFVEIYDNILIKTKSNYIRPFFIRGGTARIFNNVLKGSWTLEIEIDSEHNRNSTVSGVADANGSGKDGYPWRDQIGTGTDEFEYKGIGAWPRQELWPMYQWNNRDDNGLIGFTLTNTGDGQQRTSIEGRDFFNGVSAFSSAIKKTVDGDTVVIGYTPYPYPHPRRNGQTPQTPYTPTDTDSDGITDSLDKCPNTPPSLKSKVNNVGCPKPNNTKSIIKTDLDNKDLKKINDLKLENSSYGKIEYLEEISLIKNDGTVVDVDNDVTFAKGNISLDSSKIPELNKKAKITLYNVNVKNPVIKRDGVTCTECTVVSNSNGTLVFTVPGFSSYSIEEGTEETATPTEEETTTTPTQTQSSSSGGGGGGSRRSTSSSSSSGITLSQQDKVELLNILKILRSAGAITETKYQTALTMFNINNTSSGNTTCYQITRNLVSGSSGVDVTRLQQYLVSRGYLSMPSNTPYGYYGSLTRSAVIKYQIQNMNVTTSTPGVGNVGPLTRGSLGCI